MLELSMQIWAIYLPDWPSNRLCASDYVQMQQKLTYLALSDPGCLKPDNPIAVMDNQGRSIQHPVLVDCIRHTKRSVCIKAHPLDILHAI